MLFQPWNPLTRPGTLAAAHPGNLPERIFRGSAVYNFMRRAQSPGLTGKQRDQRASLLPNALVPDKQPAAVLRAPAGAQII
eukprot:10365729-Alexandrium_andersonii.AAC.1